MQYLQDAVAENVLALRLLWANKRQLAFQILNLAMIAFSALMIWKGLMVLTMSESPVVVVLRCAARRARARAPRAGRAARARARSVSGLVTPRPPPPPSGSMEPAFQRGDILFLSNRRPDVLAGDIVVFKVSGRDIPIVHRVLRVHSQEGGEGGASLGDFLTKGDNNPVDDRNLYAADQMWLHRPEILGTAVASIPYIGYVTIMLQDYPPLKYALVGLMGLFVLTGKEG